MAGFGHKSYIQFAPETTYGTGVPATQKLEVISMNIAPQIGIIRDPSLYNQQSHRSLYQGGLLYKGTITVRCNYEGLLELFRACTGTYANSLVETGVRDHNFKEGPQLKSYSFELIQGDVDTGKSQRLVGATVEGVTVRGTAGQGNDAMLTCEFSVTAKDMTIAWTPTASLNFPAILPIIYHQAVTIDDGTSDAASAVRVRSFEFTLGNPHDDGRFYLGALNPDQPLRSDFIMATFKFTQEFTTTTQLNDLRSFNTASPLLKFQHPTTIGVSSKRELEIRANKANITDFSNPVEGFGLLISTVTMEAWFDTTDASATVIRFRNTEAVLP